MKKYVMAVISVLAAASVMGGCDVPVQSTEPSTNPESTPGIIEPVGEYVQQPGARDYTYGWWQDGYNATGGAQYNIQTGYYALTAEPSRGGITRLGAIEQFYSQQQAGAMSEEIVRTLPKAESTDFYIVTGGQKRPLQAITPIDADGRDDISHVANGGRAISRIIESGRYMQRTDIMNLCFAGEKNISGRVEIAAMPRYLSLELSLWSLKDDASAQAGFSLVLDKKYTRFEKNENGSAVTVSGQDGAGFTAVIPDGAGVELETDEQGHRLSFSAELPALKKHSFTGFNIMIIPSAKAKPEDARLYTDAAGITASAEQIHPKAGREQRAQFDKKGYMNISLNNMLQYMGPDFAAEEKRLDEADRLKFTLENSSDAAVKLPVLFEKSGKLGVLGCCPMLRDAQTGEPIGVQVQLSKNWHEPVNYDVSQPRCYLAGTWLHGITVIEIPAHSKVTYELTVTYAQWGGVYAASHSQLCLAGWGGNYQQWESSSIGSFGESFCYDAEMTHNRGFITDIRPLAVTSIYGGKYNWTENVGGGNFLTYFPRAGGSMQQLKRVRTQFRKQGPNLTEVIYRGITQDGKIECEYTVNLPRTNDVSRAYHSFSYTFLEDTSFERLAFYSMGSDEYNDNHYDTMAVGNADGTVVFEAGGMSFGGEFALPVGQTGYIGGAMQRIKVPGDGLWAAFMGYAPVLYKKTPGANRMMVLHRYRAEINGEVYDKPAFSLYRTNNGGVPCVSFELSPPANAGNIIKKGSVVCGTAEWINLPVKKSDYYGSSSVLASIPQEYFNTWRAAYAYAKGSLYKVSANRGSVIKNTPIYVKCTEPDQQGVLAEITVTGGMGYVPLTFTNVPHYSGIRLETKKGGSWEAVDQSVTGNDYWQAWYDSLSGTYELTFNVEHTGKDCREDYRLIRR